MSFTPQEFRGAYPEFADLTDAAILDQARIAATIISLRCARLDDIAQMGMTAHLLSLADDRVDGIGVAGRVGSATIDKVAITYMAPANQNEFTLWLGSTPYGQLVAAAIASCTAGGVYIGRRPELAAIRRQR